MNNLDIIKTNAGRIKKPGKKELYAQFEDMVARMPRDVIEDNVDALAAMYLSFLPPLGKVISDPFQWVALAANPRHITASMRYVHVTGDWIIATDDHRIHAVKNTHGMESGAYNPKTGGLELRDIGTSAERLIKNFNEFCAAREEVDVELSVGVTPFVTIGGRMYNSKYYNDAIRYKADFVEYRGGVPLVIEMGDAFAVIMPFKE